MALITTSTSQSIPSQRLQVEQRIGVYIHQTSPTAWHSNMEKAEWIHPWQNNSRNPDQNMRGGNSQSKKYLFQSTIPPTMLSCSSWNLSWCMPYKKHMTTACMAQTYHPANLYNWNRTQPWSRSQQMNQLYYPSTLLISSWWLNPLHYPYLLFVIAIARPFFPRMTLHAESQNRISVYRPTHMDLRVT